MGSIASLAGVGTYNYLLKDVPLTKMFFWTSVLGTGLGLTQLILITGTANLWFMHRLPWAIVLTQMLFVGRMMTASTQALVHGARVDDSLACVSPALPSVLVWTA